jgi:allophanate hydrolase subunit 2
VGRVAQLSPGDVVRFRIVSRSEALAGLAESLAALDRLTRADTQDDAVIWAEAHE